MNCRDSSLQDKLQMMLNDAHFYCQTQPSFLNFPKLFCAPHCFMYSYLEKHLSDFHKLQTVAVWTPGISCANSNSLNMYLHAEFVVMNRYIRHPYNRTIVLVDVALISVSCMLCCIHCSTIVASADCYFLTTDNRLLTCIENVTDCYQLLHGTPGIHVYFRFVWMHSPLEMNRHHVCHHTIVLADLVINIPPKL